MRAFGPEAGPETYTAKSSRESKAVITREIYNGIPMRNRHDR